MTQNMVHSAEARWMFNESLNNTVLEWFTNTKKLGIAADAETSRTDKYLIFPASDSVGVKLRGGEGKFEIKSLAAAPHPFDFRFGSGRTDQWVKWSFKSDGLKPVEEQLLLSGRWITVKKTRYLRKFSADNGKLKEAHPKPPEGEKLPDSGCNVELTLIEIVDGAAPQTWVSLGFEAFGESSHVARILAQTLTIFFDNYGPMPGKTLTGRDCFSYPTWLATLKSND